MESNQSNAEISPEKPSDNSFIEEYLNNMEGSDVNRQLSAEEPFSSMESTDSEMLISKGPLFPIDGSKSCSQKKTSKGKEKKVHEKITDTTSSNEIRFTGNEDNEASNSMIIQNLDPSESTSSTLDSTHKISLNKSDKEFHFANTDTVHSPKKISPGIDRPDLDDVSWLSNSKQPFNIADMTFEQFQLLYYQHLFKNTEDEPSQQQLESRTSDEVVSKLSKPVILPTKSKNDDASGSTTAPSIAAKSCVATAINSDRTESGTKPAIDLSQKAAGFTLKCSRCDEVFRSRFELKAHDKRAHALDWDSNLECQTCKKKFSSKYYLIQHELTHKGDLPFPCDSCDKRFLCKGTLETHVILLHTNDRPFKCEECGAAFKLKKILMRHVATHTKESPYKCAICDKCFSRRGSLNRHEIIHSGVKPFGCELCEKRFTQKSTLTLHMMGHTNERPYQCLKCNKSFRKKGHLTRHDSVHSGKKQYYECKVCKKCFAEKYCLVQHEKIHAGDSPGLEIPLGQIPPNGISSEGLLDEEILLNREKRSDQDLVGFEGEAKNDPETEC